jgi:hypothetical protein
MFHSTYSRDLIKSGNLIPMLRPLVSVLNRAGYNYAVRFDMNQWAETRQKLDPDHQVVMPTFDPLHCDQSNS